MELYSKQWKYSYHVLIYFWQFAKACVARCQMKLVGGHPRSYDHAAGFAILQQHLKSSTRTPNSENCCLRIPLGFSLERVMYENMCLQVCGRCESVQSLLSKSLGDVVVVATVTVFQGSLLSFLAVAATETWLEVFWKVERRSWHVPWQIRASLVKNKYIITEQYRVIFKEKNLKN